MEQYEYLILSSIPGMMIMTGLNIFFYHPWKRYIILTFQRNKKEIETTRETAGQEMQLITWKQYKLIKNLF